jgi:KH domain-containing protein
MTTPASLWTSEFYSWIQQLSSLVESLDARLSALDGKEPFPLRPEPSATIQAASSSSLPSPTPPHRSGTDTRPTSAVLGTTGIPLPKAQALAAKGNAERYACTLTVPDALAAHLIGRGGRGLHQVHDISGARVSAFTLKAGSQDERHVTIRGTDLQIGDALAVIGKRLARKRVRTPKKKVAKVPPTTDPVPVPPLLSQPAPSPKASGKSAKRSSTATPLSLPPAIVVQAPTPPTRSPAPPVVLSVPPNPPSVLSKAATPFVPTVKMATAASTAPTTPAVPSVTMASPVPSATGLSPSAASTPSSPMQIDATTHSGKYRPPGARTPVDERRYEIPDGLSSDEEAAYVHRIEMEDLHRHGPIRPGFAMRGRPFTRRGR